MVRRRLTSNEREIRQSAGIPLSRLAPFAVPFLIPFVILWDSQFMQQCFFDMTGGAHRDAIGDAIVAIVRLGGAWGKLAAAITCSPRYLWDVSRHWPVIVVLVLDLMVAVPSYFWLKEHKAYWDAVRQKEKEARAAKRAAAFGEGSGSE